MIRDEEEHIDTLETRSILEGMIRDEEEHIDTLETQLEIINAGSICS